MTRDQRTLRLEILSCACFRQEFVERVVSSPDCLLTWDLTVGLSAGRTTHDGVPDKKPHSPAPPCHGTNRHGTSSTGDFEQPPVQLTALSWQQLHKQLPVPARGRCNTETAGERCGKTDAGAMRTGACPSIEYRQPYGPRGFTLLLRTTSTIKEQRGSCWRWCRCSCQEHVTTCGPLVF